MNKKNLPKKDALQTEQSWDNPKAPEEAHDEREVEQLLRQKKEAERRKENLTDDSNNVEDK